jgi:hypothetical protein
VDQSVGSAWQVDQPMGSAPRWLGKLVVIGTADLFACPLKHTPL